MTFEEYQSTVLPWAVYSQQYKLVYPALGLVGEAGEYSEKIKKLLRDDKLDVAAAARELGDVLWYLTASARDLGYSLTEIAEMNIEKLKDRNNRNVVNGEGDYR